MIESLQGKHVKDIACGSGHSAAITTNGELYTWGQGDHGRLGHGDTVNQSKPKQVRACVRAHVVSCTHNMFAGERFRNTACPVRGMWQS